MPSIQDGQEVESVPESDLISAQVSDPFVLVQRKDGIVNLYAGDTVKRRLNKHAIFTVSPIPSLSVSTQSTCAPDIRLFGVIFAHGPIRKMEDESSEPSAISRHAKFGKHSQRR